MKYYILVESSSPGSFYIPGKNELDNDTGNLIPIPARYFEIYYINSDISDLSINSQNIIVKATDQASAFQLINNLSEERIYKRLDYYEKELPFKM